jgi:hypothetical protein
MHGVAVRERDVKKVLALGTKPHLSSEGLQNHFTNFGHAARVAPLVIIPCIDLHHGAINHHRAGGIHNGRRWIVDEICGYKGLSLHLHAREFACHTCIWRHHNHRSAKVNIWICMCMSRLHCETIQRVDVSLSVYVFLYAAFAHYRVQGLQFFAFAVESYGYLDSQAMEYLRLIAAAAASTGRVKYGCFLASVHQELSVALCKGNHSLFRAGVQLYSRASGHARLPGIFFPTTEVE